MKRSKFKFFLLTIILFNIFVHFGIEKSNSNQPETNKFNYSYIETYPWIPKCNLETKLMPVYDSKRNLSNDYSSPSSDLTFEIRIIKAVIIYFPIDQYDSYADEFLWLFRSWIEIIYLEPSKWRTDLVIFIYENTDALKSIDLFRKLNCSFKNLRKSKLDKPMCTLVSFTPLKFRNLIDPELKIDQRLYNFLLYHSDIFGKKAAKILSDFLVKTIQSYPNADSVLIALDGYDHLKKSGYDFVIRSDIDVFLTPLFAKWSPKHCNDFYVGKGAYSAHFNMNRLKRAGYHINFLYGNHANLGSTWYSTTDQSRLVAYLSLFSMAYLANEEFSPPERNGDLNILLWPHWHYWVLSLYGQNLAMNHLIETKQMNIQSSDLLDYPAHENSDINKIIHIHAYHNDMIFSKFDFKEGKYDRMDMNKLNFNIAHNYALKMAIEGKFFSKKKLLRIFLSAIKNKK